MIVDLGRPGFATAGLPDTTAQDSYGSLALTAPAAFGGWTSDDHASHGQITVTVRPPPPVGDPWSDGNDMRQTNALAGSDDVGLHLGVYHKHWIIDVRSS